MWKDKLKSQWENDPMTTLLVGGFVATAAAKLIDALSAAQSRRAYSKQIDHKIKRKR